MHVLLLAVSLYISIVFCDDRENPGSRCGGYSFRCSNGQCIPSTDVCDGAIDCIDRSDETLAVCTGYAQLCPHYAFKCAYKGCIDKDLICNGKEDCADGSDEILQQCFKSSSIVKRCKIHEFQCDSGQCIDETSLCDGKRDCIDGSDETISQCINFGCPAYGFQCAYGGCIDKEKKCDRNDDCIDGSDEDSEICPTIQQTSTTIATPTRRHRPESNYGRCRLPEEPGNGNYEVVGCIKGDSSSKCLKIRDTLVNPNVALKYSCNAGYVLSEGSNLVLCKHGNWDPEPRRCLKLCEGLHSYSLDLECSYRGSIVDCGLQSRPGTEVKTKCKDTYHTNDQSSSFITTQCLSDGTWADTLYKCVPDCGIKNKINEAKLLIKNGTKVRMSEYPWHAGIYGIEDKNIAYQCGGTIIHPKAVLTAAHCVYNDALKSIIDKKGIRVAVGKYWSDWIHEDDSKTEQKFGVIDINIPKQYRGEDGNYVQDIAILHLNRLITLKPAVMPICLDKLNNYRLDQISAVGTVVGSGATQNIGPVSKELRVARLPILGFHKCLEKVNLSLFFTYDKFCAGLSNGASVQEGDSGSGMTFSRLIYQSSGFVEHHFIYGIVSLKHQNTDEAAAFTNVTVHMKWIETVIKAIEYSLKKIIPA